VATARDPAQLADLVERYGDRVRTFALDVTDPHSAGDAITAAVDAFGRLDVLVNNAGYDDIGSIEDTSLEDIHAQIETNLFGVINVTKAAIPLMRERRSGHIIQISSVGDRRSANRRPPHFATPSKRHIGEPARPRSLERKFWPDLPCFTRRGARSRVTPLIEMQDTDQ
jgi:NADP-dependent 3-hydroxy acid dehydrogenase YdfG